METATKIRIATVQIGSHINKITGNANSYDKDQLQTLHVTVGNTTVLITVHGMYCMTVCSKVGSTWAYQMLLLIFNHKCLPFTSGD